MKYEVIIRDLMTGDEILHVKSTCIIAAIHSESGSVHGVCKASCSGLEVLKTASMAEELVQKTMEQLTRIK